MQVKDGQGLRGCQGIGESPNADDAPLLPQIFIMRVQELRGFGVVVFSSAPLPADYLARGGQVAAEQRVSVE